ncbi:MAG TPA: hypothetical protein VH853_06760 [Polyangia bacterium]|jgi:hypothetical protein|nr:hypothetical protein [Polyangia bacterium]
MAVAFDENSRFRRRWTLLALPPFVWMAQGAAGWYLTGRACPVAARPIPLSTARALITVITLAALACTVSVAISATRMLRSLGTPTAERMPLTLTERSRFPAMLGLFVGVTLTLGLVFAGLPAVFVRVCGEAR